MHVYLPIWLQEPMCFCQRRPDSWPVDCGLVRDSWHLVAKAWGQQQLPELLHIFESQLDSKAVTPGMGRFHCFAGDICFEHPAYIA